MDYRKTDDQQLMRLIAQGNPDALGALYDRYGRLIFSVAYNSIGDNAIAEEIVQDVFTRAWEKSNTYDGKISKVSTWLITITRNRAIDELRRGRVRVERFTVGWEDAEQVNELSSNGPEEISILSLEQIAVRNAVARLPEEQRKTLALAYFRGYTHSEIAELLGEPLGTVKTRIRLAMQKVRQVLLEQLTDAG